MSRLKIDPSLLALPVALLVTGLPSWAAAQGEPALDAAAAPGADAALAADAEPASDARMAVDPRVLGPMPTLQAVTGLYHLTSAQTSQPLTFRLSMFGQYFSGSDVVRANDEDSRFIGTLGLSVTPLPWLEPYLVLSARSNANTFSNPETVLSQGDTMLGVKGVTRVAPAFHVGGELRLIFLNGAGDTSFDFDATGARLAALGTFDGGELARPIPLRAHVNVGYLVDNSDQLLPEDADGRKLPPDRVERFAQSLSAYDQVELGLGVEVPLPWVTLHAEYNLGLLTGQEPAALCGPDQPLPCPAEAGFGGNPQTLTLGVKGQPLQGLVLNGGLDIGLATKDVSGVPITAPYNLIFGLAYVFDPRPKVVEVEKIVEKPVVVEARPKVGALDGKVLDADTGEPVPGAIVTYAGTALTRQTSDAADGAFRSYEFEVGQTIRVQVDHPEYEGQTVEATVQEGDNALALKLRPLGKKGVVAGTVKAGGGAASGTVILTGPRTYKINLEEGRFGQKVLVGRYTVAVTVSGYLTAGRDIELAEGGESTLNLELAPRPEVSTVTVTENRLLVDGRIEFDGAAVKPESLARLDQIVAVLFEHPEFTRVRIEGHTDDKGPEKKRVELSQGQADAVLKYLTDRGVSADRLEARGFGDSQPLVPNISPRNREINRRVAFTIVSKRAADGR